MFFTRNLASRDFYAEVLGQPLAPHGSIGTVATLPRCVDHVMSKKISGFAEGDEQNLVF